MTAFFVSLLAIPGFVFVLWRTEFGQTAQNLVASASGGVSAMFDRELSDDEKESAIRRSAIELLARTWQLTWRIVLAILAAAVPIFLADAVGLAPASVVLGLMVRLDYIVGVSLLVAGIAYLVRRLRRTEDVPGADDVSYGAADTFVHTLAFSTPGVMRGLAKIDNRAFSRFAKQSNRTPPIFITSLARGGTTALLNAFHDLPAIATHTYRDMPFITAPFLWSKIGGAGSRRVDRRERAHGDGLEIDLDSPEAFEEVLWRMYWSEKYRDDSIEIWQGPDRSPPSIDGLSSHFDKIVHLRRNDRNSGELTRYLSKNNNNIARLRVLNDYFPGCDVIVPIRRPAAHAASLMRQHLRFVDIQQKDDFVRRYMLDIGHLEFGLLHRPIAFEKFEPGTLRPSDADYWLSYWIAAFEEARENCAGAHLVTQDGMRSRPNETMGALCAKLDLPNAETDFASYFRNEPDKTPDHLFSDALLTTANALYDDLGERAVG